MTSFSPKSCGQFEFGAVQECANLLESRHCKMTRMLQNGCLLGNVGFDTNRQWVRKKLTNSDKFAKNRSRDRGHPQPRVPADSYDPAPHYPTLKTRFSATKLTSNENKRFGTTLETVSTNVSRTFSCQSEFGDPEGGIGI